MELGRVPVVATGTLQSGRSVRWDTAITAHGGQYRLCWCSVLLTTKEGLPIPACRAPDDYVDGGWHLNILGPRLNAVRTCVRASALRGRDVVL